jgi:type VI secretion system protein VasD
MEKPFPVIVLAFMSLLAGCSSDPPQPAPAPSPPPPTRVQIKVEALPDLNPDGSGRPSPLLLRIYQLRTVAAFNGADFFELYQNEKTALAADLVQKEEFTLRPGDQRELAFEPKPDTQIVAAFAVFRNLDSAQWRASAPLAPRLKNPIEIRLTGNQLTLTAAPLPAEPPPAAKPAPEEEEEKEE